MEATNMQTVNNNSKWANQLLYKALNFDLTDITERYKDTYKVSDEIAKLHEEECKKYLLLCSLFPEEKLGMKGIVDNYWHTFLLFTKDYVKFCNAIGSTFIHHIPNTKKNCKAESSFTKTMEMYRLTFGCEPNSKAWQYNMNSSSDCDPDTDGCGESTTTDGDCSACGNDGDDYLSSH